MTASVQPTSTSHAAPRTVKPPHSTKQQAQARSVAVPRTKATTDASAVITGRSVQEWLNAECRGFKGMRASRPQTWDDIQEVADRLYKTGVFGEEQTLTADVPVGEARDEASMGPLDEALRSTAARMVAPLTDLGLPDSCAKQVLLDAEEIGVAVAELVPTAQNLILKLELMRENVCARWHQDNYIARAIVSYNCSGTEWIHDDYVDFWELNNCGKNDCVVRDRRQVCQAGVGDALLIKGKWFPEPVNALVHRSPDLAYYASGEIKTRLVLKVDVHRKQ